MTWIMYSRGFPACLQCETILINNKLTKLVIFDCDGVLIDSEIISANVLIQCMQELGIDISYEYIQQNFFGRSFSFVSANIAENFNATLPQDIEIQYRRKLLQAFKMELQPIAGIADVLRNLSVEFCLASSSSLERIRSSLEYTALSDWFDGRIFSAYEVENGKPAPDLFLYAAKTMGYSADDCLVIEDSLSGVQAGINAGMEVIHFVGGSHLQNLESPIFQDDRIKIPVIRKWPEFFDIKPALKR